MFFIREKAKGSAVGIQVFIDGVLTDVRAINACSGAYGGEWNEDKTMFTIPDVPKDAVEIKDGWLTIHEPKRDSVDFDEAITRTEVVGYY